MPRTASGLQIGRALESYAVLLISLGLLILDAGCAGAVGRGTTSSNVTVTLTPTSASVLLGASVAFSAAVSGSSNKAVAWTVNGVMGGNAQVGSISAGGQYTAPQILPTPSSVTVTAIAQAETNATASAAVAITSGVSVSISPVSATVAPEGSQAFVATVTSAGNPAQSVTWSVNGIASGNSNVGTISSTGPDSAIYTAPAELPNPPVVSVTATSVADASKSASAVVTITAACSGTNTISPAGSERRAGAISNLYDYVMRCSWHFDCVGREWRCRRKCKCRDDCDYRRELGYVHGAGGFAWRKSTNHSCDRGSRLCLGECHGGQQCRR